MELWNTRYVIGAAVLSLSQFFALAVFICLDFDNECKYMCAQLFLKRSLKSPKLNPTHFFLNWSAYIKCHESSRRCLFHRFHWTLSLSIWWYKAALEISIRFFNSKIAFLSWKMTAVYFVCFEFDWIKMVFGVTYAMRVGAK